MKSRLFITKNNVFWAPPFSSQKCIFSLFFSYGKNKPNFQFEKKGTKLKIWQPFLNPKTKVFGSSIETLKEEIDRESENYNCIQLGLNQRRSWRNRIMSAVQSTTLPWMLKKKHLLGNSVPEKKQFFKNIASSQIFNLGIPKIEIILSQKPKAAKRLNLVKVFGKKSPLPNWKFGNTKWSRLSQNDVSFWEGLLLNFSIWVPFPKIESFWD